MGVLNVPIRQIIKVHYGKALKQGDRVETGIYEVFGSSGCIGHHDEALVGYPTLVVGRKGSVGEIIWAPNGGWVIDTAFYVELLEHNSVDLRYLFYALKIANLGQKKITTSIPGLNRDDFYNTEIPLPPLAEQKRIAAILDKADALRRKRQQAIELADQFLRSVFLDMFGDPVTNPKGFDKAPLGDLIKVSSGNGLTAKDMAANGVHPVFGGNGINGYHDEYMFDKPKIVIGRVGAYCGVVHVTQPKSWVTDNALYVKESVGELQDSYLEHALKIANLNQYASQAGQPLISGSRIYPVEILLPPYGLQEKFQMLKRKSEKIHDELLSTKQVAENLFCSLSQKAFTGVL